MHPVGLCPTRVFRFWVFAARLSVAWSVQVGVRGACHPGVWMIAAHDGKSSPYGGSDRLVGTLWYRAYRAIRTG